MSGRLLRALTRVGSGTLASRVLGFVRDVVVARAFGAGTGADAFFVAFRIPNLLRRLFAEGAFSQAFVPVITEYRERRSRELNTNKAMKRLRSMLRMVRDEIGEDIFEAENAVLRDVASCSRRCARDGSRSRSRRPAWSVPRRSSPRASS